MNPTTIHYYRNSTFSLSILKEKNQINFNAYFFFFFQNSYSSIDFANFPNRSLNDSLCTYTIFDKAPVPTQLRIKRGRTQAKKESGKVAFTGIWIVRVVYPEEEEEVGRSHGWGRAEAEGSGSNRQEEEAAAAFWGPFCSQLPDLPTLRVCTYLPTTYPPYYLTPNSVWVCMYRLYIENSNHFERSIKFLLLGIEFLAIFQESWWEPRRNTQYFV